MEKRRPEDGGAQSTAEKAPPDFLSGEGYKGNGEEKEKQQPFRGKA